MLDSKWIKDKKFRTQIWDEDKGEYCDALTTGDYLICYYGGVISVVEVPANQGEKRIETLDSKGINMIANI